MKNMINCADWPEPAPRVLALGFFDGVHLGHRALLKEALAWGRSEGLPVWVVTFAQHPLSLLCPERMPGLLTTRPEREAILARLGVDGMVELLFTRALSQMPPEGFLQRLLAMGARGLVAGENYSFGRLGAGHAAELVSGPVPARIVPMTPWGGAPVSSSRIRQALAEGETERAAALLGAAYGFTGVVTRGKQLGRTLDFPTVNLLPGPEKALPALGVYTGWVNDAPAVVNVGPNPTVEVAAPVKVEAHVLSGAVPDYGEMIRISLGRKLRGEVKFPSVEALRHQVMSDKEQAKAWHEKNELE